MNLDEARKEVARFDAMTTDEVAGVLMRLHEDKARLDWMQEHACEEGRTMAMPRYSYRVKQWNGDPGPNIRSAIDTARKDA